MLLISAIPQEIVNAEGIDTLISPIVEMINEFYDGVSLWLPLTNQVITINAATLALLDDNLAAHQACDMETNFANGRYICRHCLQPKEKFDIYEVGQGRNVKHSQVRMKCKDPEISKLKGFCWPKQINFLNEKPLVFYNKLNFLPK
eukprot:gb/GECH01010144.1/.p1 GENE.gb/GECH01010144.1/~~gb/GECH01010144.1/.p1  ORF type:complete len:146 (+),score=13.77 gb/GECH01010144.1/:1-438(+)